MEPKNRLNWTKVGLKAGNGDDILVVETGLNWTKVGLKGNNPTPPNPYPDRFELD